MRFAIRFAFALAVVGLPLPAIRGEVIPHTRLEGLSTERDGTFGSSVALSSNTMVVGVPLFGSDFFENPPITGSGAVFVFVREGTSWALQAILQSARNTVGQFGAAVAISGDTIVVGAPLDSSLGLGVNPTPDNPSGGPVRSSSGAACIFVRQGNAWSEDAFFKAPNADANDFFGTSVAISGNTVLVGAPGEDSDFTGASTKAQNDNDSENAGAAYLYSRGSNGIWKFEAYLKASNTGAGDEFGASVALTGNIALAGAPGEDGNSQAVNGNQGNNSAPGSGAAYIFRRIVRSGLVPLWSQEAYLKASNSRIGDAFGTSAAIDGTTAVVGADGRSGGFPSRGSAAVFLRLVGGSGAVSWVQEGLLEASNPDHDDRFGTAVAVAGDTILVGSPNEDSAATDVDGVQQDNSAFGSGAAYLFSRDGGIWSQTAYLKDSDTDANDRFGDAVAVTGSFLAVGASHAGKGIFGDPVFGVPNQFGAVRVFENTSFEDRLTPRVRITSSSRASRTRHLLTATATDNLSPVRLSFRLKPPGSRTFLRRVVRNLPGSGTEKTFSTTLNLKQEGRWMVEVIVSDLAGNESKPELRSIRRL